MARLKLLRCGSSLSGQLNPNPAARVYFLEVIGPLVPCQLAIPDFHHCQKCPRPSLERHCAYSPKVSYFALGFPFLERFSIVVSVQKFGCDNVAWFPQGPYGRLPLV